MNNECHILTLALALTQQRHRSRTHLLGLPSSFPPVPYDDDDFLSGHICVCLHTIDLHHRALSMAIFPFYIARTHTATRWWKREREREKTRRI